jgi:hypothetical protein
MPRNKNKASYLRRQDRRRAKAQEAVNEMLRRRTVDHHPAWRRIMDERIKTVGAYDVGCWVNGLGRNEFDCTDRGTGRTIIVSIQYPWPVELNEPWPEVPAEPEIEVHPAEDRHYERHEVYGLSIVQYLRRLGAPPLPAVSRRPRPAALELP